MTTQDITRFEAYRAQRMFGSLNGLRFICIAMVLWHHGPLSRLIDEPAEILTRGFAGVDFFFVLSGYLITTLLLREEDRNGRFSIVDFYWRRALRILPVYFLAISAIGFWWIVVRGQDHLVGLLPYYYLFGANFLNNDIPLLSPMWSLAVEEQYYLIWPALLLLLPALGVRFLALLALIGVCLLVGAGVLPKIEPLPPTQHATFVLPVANYLAILVGSLLAIALHHQRGFSVLWTLVGHRWAPLLGFVVTAIVLQILPALAVHYIIPFFMALTLAALVVREDHILASVFAARPIARLGEISYGVYIWHLVGLHIGNVAADVIGLEGAAHIWMVMIVFLIASVVIAELSFRYFESWFLRLKERRPSVRRRA